MSQQGGVYPPREVKVPEFARPASPSKYKLAANKGDEAKPSAGKSADGPKVTDVVKKHDSSPEGQSQEAGKSDGQQWEVVNDPKQEQEKEEKKHDGGFSSSFNFQLGWGKWKFSPFSWEVNVNNQKAYDRNHEGHSHGKQGHDQTPEFGSG